MGKARYSVRKQSSGRTFSESYYVYDLVRKGRVTVHAHQHRQSAEVDARALEIAAMVPPAAEDARPYAVRLAEAEQRYAAGERSR